MRTQSMKIDIQTAFSLLFLFFLNRSRWTARVRRRAILFPLSTPKSPLLLIICNLPALFYFLARPWLQGKRDDHSRSNRYQSFCKLMVIELNWVKCNLVCIWSDGRAAWLKKKKKKIVDEVFVISGIIILFLDYLGYHKNRIYDNSFIIHCFEENNEKHTVARNLNWYNCYWN